MSNNYFVYGSMHRQVPRQIDNLAVLVSKESAKSDHRAEYERRLAVSVNVLIPIVSDNYSIRERLYGLRDI